MCCSYWGWAWVYDKSLMNLKLQLPQKRSMLGRYQFLFVWRLFEGSIILCQTVVLLDLQIHLPSASFEIILYFAFQISALNASRRLVVGNLYCLSVVSCRPQTTLQRSQPVARIGASSSGTKTESRNPTTDCPPVSPSSSAKRSTKRRPDSRRATRSPSACGTPLGILSSIYSRSGRIRPFSQQPHAQSLRPSRHLIHNSVVLQAIYFRASTTTGEC